MPLLTCLINSNFVLQSVDLSKADNMLLIKLLSVSSDEFISYISGRIHAVAVTSLKSCVLWCELWLFTTWTTQGGDSRHTNHSSMLLMVMFF